MAEPTVHNNNELMLKNINNAIARSSERDADIRNRSIPEKINIFELLQRIVRSNNSNDSNQSLEQPLAISIPEIGEIQSAHNLIHNNLDAGVYKKRKGPKTKEEERRHQMAKNREYARKCVQKKKDQRNEAADRSDKLYDQIEALQKSTATKEKNANFAVELLKSTNEEIMEVKRKYEETKAEVKQLAEKDEASDDTVNINYGRLEDAKEEFKKATEDLKTKNGVIGTLGSRKIRAKQHMEWRLHLYNISVQEHGVNREQNLAKLVDGYVAQTVPLAAPLVKTIPKILLDELIRCNRTKELEEFYRFVERNQQLFETVPISDVG